MVVVAGPGPVVAVITVVALALMAVAAVAGPLSSGIYKTRLCSRVCGPGMDR